jgi:hypothetical protein
MKKEFFEALAKPFAPNELSIRPGNRIKSGDAVIVLAYLDVATIENRLDAVCGQFNAHWESRKEILSGTGNTAIVKCSLVIHLDGAIITREDFGEEAVSKENVTEIFKSASSDSFKRAARAFGVGRYLQSIPFFTAKVDEKGYFIRKDEEIVSELYRRMNIAA